jgi:hypothetical protein
MATQSTDITFTTGESVSAKNITLGDTSTYASGDLSWASGDSRILVKIVDPQGTTFYNNTDTATPDFTSGGSSKSLNLPTDSDSLVVRGINLITLTYFDGANVLPSEFYSVSITAGGINIAANTFSTGQSIVYSSEGEPTIAALTDGDTYYVSATSNVTKIFLSTTRANAIAGTDLTLVATSGIQKLTATQFERTFQFDNSYASPTADLDLSYSVINPIYFKAVDSTSYAYNSVSPSITGTLTLTHPQGLGSYVSNIDATTKTLNTKVFYYSTDPDITSVVALSANSTYTFAGYYSDAVSTNVTWTLLDLVSGAKGIYVSGGSDGCDLYCCMKALEQQLDAAINTGNKTNEARLTSLFNRASNLWQLVQSAYNCSKSSDAASYTAEIKDLLNCTGECGSSEIVSQVVGIGTTPDIVRLGNATMIADVSSYVFAGLINYNYADGDVIITVDGANVASIGTYSISLNSITGEVTFGTTVYTGVKVAYHIIKP